MKKLIPIAATSLTRYIFLLFIVSAFVGCKTEETVSLREAKTITAEFVGKTFKAPPRSSEDLIELAKTHDRQPASDAMADLRREAQAEPSEAIKNDPAAYAVFLKERSEARRRIGDIPGALYDARMAYRIFIRDNPQLNDVGGFLRWIAWSEFLGGDFAEAVRIAEMAFEHASSIRIHVHLSQLLRFGRVARRY